jgi:hypothetical protein
VFVGLSLLNTALTGMPIFGLPSFSQLISFVHTPSISTLISVVSAGSLNSSPGYLIVLHV